MMMNLAKCNKEQKKGKVTLMFSVPEESKVHHHRKVPIIFQHERKRSTTNNTSSLAEDKRVNES